MDSGSGDEGMAGATGTASTGYLGGVYFVFDFFIGLETKFIMLSPMDPGIILLWFLLRG